MIYTPGFVPNHQIEEALDLLGVPYTHEGHCLRIRHTPTFTQVEVRVHPSFIPWVWVYVIDISPDEIAVYRERSDGEGGSEIEEQAPRGSDILAILALVAKWTGRDLAQPGNKSKLEA